MADSTQKSKLIEDIVALLNAHQDVGQTYINPSLLEFMDDAMLKNIISDLLSQKEHQRETNREWLKQFKTFQHNYCEQKA